MRTTLTAAALATAAALTIAGCGSKPATITAHGTLDVFASPLGGQSVQTAYPDITSGSQVTIKNPGGSVVGTGTLVTDAAATAAADAQMAAAVPGTSPSTYSAWVEAFTFTAKVPGGLSRYGITIGSHGTIWFTLGEMRKGPTLSLGNMG